MMIIDGRPHDLGGGLLVHRILPFAKKRMVGPFTFLDHMGPVTAKAHQNTDVRPHPHIGLSTLTYLLEGRMVHHDSLGHLQTIMPGEVNWMTAGSGISHSERTHADDRDKDHKLHGLQFWVALPDGAEEVDPSFQHYDSKTIPKLEGAQYTMRLVAGEGFGMKSSVKTSSPLIFADFEVAKDAEIPFEFPRFETAVYVIEGNLTLEGQTIGKHQMAAFETGQSFKVKAAEGTRFVLIGGEAFATPRHMWWNLVSSSKERIELAKQQWRDKTFPMVPGETEFIPLPEN